MNEEKTSKIKIAHPKLFFVSFALLVFFAFYHYSEVVKAVKVSKDTFLSGGYIRLVVILLALCIFCAFFYFDRTLGYVKNAAKPGFKRWKTEILFLITGLVLGLSYMQVLPGLSAPDEPCHYISAYRISNTILGNEEYRNGESTIVRADDALLESGNQALGQSEIVEDTYKTIYNWKNDHERIPGTKKSTLPAVSTTPVVYIPQALGITLARLLDTDALGVVFLGRLFNLIVYLFLVMLAIHIIPFGKDLVFATALLPMSIHLSSSMSYDAMVMGLSFLYIAQILKLAASEKKISIKDAVLPIFIMSVLGPCKIVYSVLVFLVFLIPKENFRHKGAGKTAYILVTLAVCLSAVLIIQSRMIYNYTAVESSTVAWAQESGYTFSELIRKPYIVFKMLYQTVIWQTEFIHTTMLGAYLGNVNTSLDVPYIVIVFFTLGLLLLALKKPGETNHFTGFKRIIALLVCAGVFFATLLTMLLAWTTCSAVYILGVQGRYFLPILPLSLCLCKNDTVVLTRDINTQILYIFVCMNAYSLFRLYAFICLHIPA